VVTKLDRKKLPKGFRATDFKYEGRPAKDQGDFGSSVGIADMACVDQFGEANNAKYYHTGVVTAKSKWFVYLEWGRIKGGGKSWESKEFTSQDFQFVQCDNEDDARAFFEKQSLSKNLKRLVQEGKIWGSKLDKSGKSKDGYIVQPLATRERGLPDAYSIKDTSGLKTEGKKKKGKKTAVKSKSAKTFQPQVIDLAASLVGGVKDYARAASAATGIIPTMDSIRQVRDDLIPEAGNELARIGDDIDKQIKDKKLIKISKMVAALVPRPMPRGKKMTAEERAVRAILSANNILAIQQDLDAFEAALKNESFEVEFESGEANPNDLLGCNVTWIDPSSTKGKWITNTYMKMSNNRHRMRGSLKIKNVFEVERPSLDKAFVKAAKDVAKKRTGTRLSNRARLQPRTRNDVSDVSDIYGDANIFMGIHGTRAVNVQPIISSNLRMPKSLKGVHVTGAAFGHGIYFATDWRKSHGYTGHGGSYYGDGGNIKGRGFFMFLCDVIMGKPHMARTTMWNAVSCPRDSDSIAAYPNFTSVQNDEHVIFNPNYQRIRYIVEGDIR
jgi:hypothetical protein